MDKLSAATMPAFLARHPLVVIAFIDRTSAVARDFLPVLQELHDEVEDVAVAVVDVGDEPLMAQDFRVQAVPTVAVLKAQHLLYLEAGAISRVVFDAVLDAARKARVPGAPAPR